MHDTIQNFPSQFKSGLGSAKDFKLETKHDKIVVSGMGGSLLPAEIVLTLLETTKNKLEPNFWLNRSYDLPAGTSKKDLSICISWSGNTEETISSYEASLKLGMETVVITNGGKLAEQSKKNKNHLVLMDGGKTPPRLAVGYMTAGLLKVLGLENELNFDLDPSAQEKNGKELAEKIRVKTPVIYASYTWRNMAKLWKIFFNENSKIPAFWNYFPGLAHNELAGFTTSLRDFHHIFIVDKGDDPRQNKNIEAAIAIFNKLGYNYTIINTSSSGVKPLEKIFNNYVLGLWTSYYLGKSLGVDPENTRLIEEFKQLKK